MNGFRRFLFFWTLLLWVANSSVSAIPKKDERNKSTQQSVLQAHIQGKIALSIRGIYNPNELQPHLLSVFQFGCVTFQILLCIWYCHVVLGCIPKIVRCKICLSPKMNHILLNPSKILQKKFMRCVANCKKMHLIFIFIML